MYILFNRRPTGSHGASPKAHLSCLIRYLLSLRALSRLASETSGLVGAAPFITLIVRIIRNNERICNETLFLKTI